MGTVATMSTWGTDPEGMRAKSRADEEARKAADEARAAEAKRERIWEAIYAGAFVRLFYDLPGRNEEAMRVFDNCARATADLWRETVTKPGDPCRGCSSCASAPGSLRLRRGPSRAVTGSIKLLRTWDASSG